MLKFSSQLISLDDYEIAAKAGLPETAYEYIASGSGDEWTLRRNRSVFDDIQILPKTFIDVSMLNTKATLFGREHAFPILLAPTGYHRLFHPGGELETVRGAGLSHTTLVAACFSTTSFEEMQDAATEPLWFQLYVQNDRGYTRELLERVIHAGAEAICITADLPVNAARDREMRIGFELPPGMSRTNLEKLGANVAQAAHSSNGTVYNAVRSANVTWKDIEWIRSFVSVPLLVKGILRGEDAVTAQKCGCDGVIVSNHGGRSLDGIPASMSVLPEIADRVGAEITVLLDGGIRRGADILKALASGARAVLIGRPYLYGLAVDGASGVAKSVEILQTELIMAMGLAGCPTIADIDASLLRIKS